MARHNYKSRRRFLGTGAAAGAALLAGKWSSLGKAAPAAKQIPGNDEPWIEATIPQLQALMNTRKLTSRGLVQGCLARIDALNPLLGAVIETNPQAVSIAAQGQRRELRDAQFKCLPERGQFTIFG